MGVRQYKCAYPGCSFQSAHQEDKPFPHMFWFCATHGSVWIRSLEAHRALTALFDFIRRIEDEERNSK